MLRKQDWKALGGFNEDYFMYGEEADLCYRAAQRGLRCLICPNAQIIDYGGVSEKVRSEKFLCACFVPSQNCLRCIGIRGRKMGILTLDLWAFVRLIAYGLGQAVTNSNGEHLETWRQVWMNSKRVAPLGSMSTTYNTRVNC